MKPRLAIASIVVCLASGRAFAQTDGPVPQSAVAPAAKTQPETRALSMTMSFANLVDGNVSHSSDPIRSYGAVPSLELRQERPNGTGWGWSYELAAHNYTGTDEWDRFSHNLEAFVGQRLTGRLRTETSAEANWKGSSDDRELANTFGIGQRATYRVTAATRFTVGGAWRYKVYTDTPETTGPSPYIGAKLDQRLLGQLRLTAGYRHQIRRSQSIRDRYRRDAYSLTIARPLGPGGRLSVDLERRRQQYERLVKVAGRQVPRIDHRMIAEVAYARRLGDRSEVRWIWGFESRSSTDRSKGFADPTFGVTMGYRLR
jgi:hypothetical protein